MLPDFPEVKDYARRIFVKAVRTRVPQLSPVLEGIRRTRVHEGRLARMTREDRSTAEIDFKVVGAELKLTREEMKRLTPEDLHKHISHMAEQFAEQESYLMFATISNAVEEVGNSVSAAEIGNKEAFLEMNRRMQLDFDPETLQPKDTVIVLHPSQVESVMAQVKEWEQDPDFTAELNRIREKQIEDWRARENRRKLVD